METGVYKAIDGPCSPEKIVSRIADTYGGELSVTKVRSILDQFIEQDLAIQDGDNYIGLALQPCVDLPLGQRSRMYRHFKNLNPVL